MRIEDVVIIVLVSLIISGSFALGVYRSDTVKTSEYLVERNKQLEARVEALRTEAERCRIKKGASK